MLGIFGKLISLGDRLNKLAGEPRIAARHIQGLVLGKRNQLVGNLGAFEHVDPPLVQQVIGFHTRGAIPAYRGVEPETPKITGIPIQTWPEL